MKNKIVIIAIVAVLVVGAGAFWGGMKYQESRGLAGLSSKGGNLIFSGQPGQGAMAGNFRNVGNAANGDLINGEIIAKDEKSLTLKLRDGGSKIVFYSASTQLQEMASTTPASLVIGKQITASGTANSDGSVTAKSIQLRQDFQPAAK